MTLDLTAEAARLDGQKQRLEAAKAAYAGKQDQLLAIYQGLAAVSVPRPAPILPLPCGAWR